MFAKPYPLFINLKTWKISIDCLKIFSHREETENFYFLQNCERVVKLISYSIPSEYLCIQSYALVYLYINECRGDTGTAGRFLPHTASINTYIRLIFKSKLK